MEKVTKREDLGLILDMRRFVVGKRNAPNNLGMPVKVPRELTFNGILNQFKNNNSLKN